MLHYITLQAENGTHVSKQVVNHLFFFYLFFVIVQFAVFRRFHSNKLKVLQFKH